MKQHIRELSEADLQKSFPIQGKSRGWYFRVIETSNGVWLVEGADAFGRQVSRQGHDVDQLIVECENDAEKINEMIG